jgi:hypothetical protein
LRRDSYGGQFSGGVLPPVGMLAERYGVCTHTMRKALRLLADEGVVVRQRRRLVLSTPRPHPYATVVLLARGQLQRIGKSEEAVFLPLSSRTQEQLRALELYCARLDVHLQCVPCVYVGAGLKAGMGDSDLGRVLRRRPVVGALVWTMAIDLRSVRELVRTLSRRARRIALLDDNAESAPLSWVQSPASVRCHSVACGPGDGRVAARYLLRLGHRRCALITGWPEQAWSQNRLRGAMEAFAEAGHGSAELFAPSVLENPSRDRTTVADIRVALEGVLDRSVPRSDGWHGLLRAEPPLFDGLSSVVGRALLQRRLESVFERCAGRRDITAWLCANDAVALEALRFARSRGIRVPGEISIVGFDDCAEALYRNLTTVNFNAPALVRAMVDYVLVDKARPWWAGEGAAAGAVESFVVERGSSGSCPKA